METSPAADRTLRAGSWSAPPEWSRSLGCQRHSGLLCRNDFRLPRLARRKEGPSVQTRYATVSRRQESQKRGKMDGRLPKRSGTAAEQSFPCRRQCPRPFAFESGAGARALRLTSVRRAISVALAVARRTPVEVGETRQSQRSTRQLALALHRSWDAAREGSTGRSMACVK